MVYTEIMSQDARRDDERATERRARLLELNYIDTSQIVNKVLYKNLMPVEELYRMRVIPLQASEHAITFGVTNTTSQHMMNEITQRFLDQRVSFALISEMGYHEYMHLYDPPKQVVYQDIELTTAGTQELIGRVSQMLNQVRADDMLAYLVQQAHKLAASDIHLENQTEYVRIRFRIDGVLHPVARLTYEKYRILISAVASAANVSTSASEPQQGHIREHVKMADGSEVNINLRVETVPAIGGMDVVMRLFNLEPEMYTLDRLGLSPKERAVVDGIIEKPSGLVLAVGPTGSGKTTTLYSILNTLNNEERKIITIEDPVEFQFNGITQISVTTKTGEESHFANKLRAVLRLDPDIVMVGEIRDPDTAKTALQASLTGHLVLSTFHAASASAALTRLLDIIGENPLFLSAIRLVMAQRLVRKLDDQTKQAYDPPMAIIESIQKVVAGLPPGLPKPSLEGLKLYRPGSSADNPYGYRGQLALREQFLMSRDMVELLQKSGKQLSTQNIEEAAVRSGMMTMMQDGILKVIAGQTTLEEVYRVLD